MKFEKKPILTSVETVEANNNSMSKSDIEEWDINKYLSFEEQDELMKLKQSLGDLHKIIKNPWQFINDKNVGEIIQKITKLHMKAKEIQKKTETEN